MEQLADALTVQGLLPEHFTATYDEPLDTVASALRGRLGVPGAAQFDELLGQARAEAADMVAALVAGQPHPRWPASSRAGDPCEMLVQPAGGEDPEAEPASAGLQMSLCRLLDAKTLEGLAARFSQQGRWADVRRLRDLRDGSVSHDWLWALHPAHGATIPPEEFATCVRIRLGAFLTVDPVLCERCGTRIADRTGSHGLCCAIPEATRGHYSVRDAVLHLVHLADASATTEEPELIPSAPTLRPADIYTESALPGGRAALDVGICSPDASGAGADCCAAMWTAKRDKYAPFVAEMREGGLCYVPLVFSCYGRAHPESAVALERIAAQAARRLGVRDHRGLLRRARASVGVAIWRRAVAMALSCLPALTPQASRLLFAAGTAEECG